MPDYDGLKNSLRGLIDERRQKKVEEESQRRFRNDEDRNKILENIGKDVADSIVAKLTPVLEELAKNAHLSSDQIKEAFRGAEISIPPIKIPRPEVIVNVPPVSIPEIRVPEQKVVFPPSFKIDSDRANPVPVILTDTKGQVYSMQFMGGASGGGKVKQYQEADTASLITGLALLAEGASDTLYPLQVGSGVADMALRVVNATDVSTSVNVTGFTSSVATVGDVVADAADTGEAPVKTGGIARTANPTAVADGDRVSSSYDDLGRQVITPYQVRDLVVTAFLALATGTETAVLAGAASTLRDLVHVVCANQSDAAVDIDFRFGTGGSIVFSLTVPADATAGFVPAVPVPMSEVAQALTADMADISGTTVNISALFINNV